MLASHLLITDQIVAVPHSRTSVLCLKFPALKSIYTITEAVGNNFSLCVQLSSPAEAVVSFLISALRTNVPTVNRSSTEQIFKEI